jgi:hypothetical protein
LSLCCISEAKFTKYLHSQKRRISKKLFSFEIESYGQRSRASRTLLITEKKLGGIIVYKFSISLERLALEL